MTTALDSAADATEGADPFRGRLLDGLATSIGERGYRDTTVADIVRHARTSKRTFYEPVRQQGRVLHRAAADQQRGADRQHPSGRRSRCGVAGPDPPGGRRLRRPHRVAAGDHAELDSGSARARRGGPAAAPPGHGAPHRHAGRPQRQPGVPARAAAARLPSAGADPAGRLARTDRAVRRGRPRRARHRRARRHGVDGHPRAPRADSSPESAAPTSPAGRAMSA